MCAPSLTALGLERNENLTTNHGRSVRGNDMELKAGSGRSGIAFLLQLLHFPLRRENGLICHTSP